MIPRQLEVWLHGHKIGDITHLGDDRTIFAFDETYSIDLLRPVLSLGFRNQLGELITQHPTTQTQLLPYFSNLLPEGALRSFLARQFKVKPMREFPLLAALGGDLPGAVVIRIADEGNSRTTLDSVSAQAIAMRHGEGLRFSLAGLQLKFSAFEKKTGRLTIPVDGRNGSWIVKLPSHRFAHLANNEFSMLSLARLIGIDVPEIRLMRPESIEGLPAGIEHLQEAVFAIRRFDRGDEGLRIHTEDFAQVLGVYPEEKYEHASYRTIAGVIWNEIGVPGVIEFVRRLVFMVLIGNTDMHLKNWSFIYRDCRTTQLAPAYDYVSTITYLPDDEVALKFARTRKMSELTLDELKYLAEKAKIPVDLVIDTARETVMRFHEVWNAEKSCLPIPEQLCSVIDRHLLGLPIAKS